MIWRMNQLRSIGVIFDQKGCFTIIYFCTKEDPFTVIPNGFISWPTKHMLAMNPKIPF